MKNIADFLNEKIITLKSPVVVGLDPVLNDIPMCYKEKYLNYEDEFFAISEIIFDFSRDVIDTVFELVPAVKPQIAFYEMYGYLGVRAFEKTIRYAKSKGLIVIEDGKRNDIGNTAQAYADGHIGNVTLLNGKKAPSFDVDFLTVSPFLGSESLNPFINECINYNKGLFILVKTSNKSSGEIQNLTNQNGLTVSQIIAHYINNENQKCIGESGYSPIGAVVGATYPFEAQELRKIMTNNIFLVPGYGAQGAEVDDILPCFNADGLGAIVNSSRGILYSYKSHYNNIECTKDELKKSVKDATETMRNEIYKVLVKTYNNMLY